MKFILDLLSLCHWGRVVDLVYDVVKGYFVRSYVGLVEYLRGMYFIALLTISCLMLLLSGFLLLHVALFLHLSWSMDHKILLMSTLGGIYILSPLVLIPLVHSHSRWLKRSGAKKLMESLRE